MNIINRLEKAKFDISKMKNLQKIYLQIFVTSSSKQASPTKKIFISFDRMTFKKEDVT